jgi:putative ATPase
MSLAEKIRPKILEHFIGQKHLVGEDGPIRVAINKKHPFSFILWGPPGSGKTTLARIYANSLEAELFELSAVSAGKDDIRKIVNFKSNRYKILFLDEIHRFNKGQQDFLLPYVESGELFLIGATTENPSFEVITPLLSRCKVFVLKSYSEDEIKSILKRIGEDIPSDALDWLVSFAEGDARRAISMVEMTLTLYHTVNLANLKKVSLSNTLKYDKKGEEHFNLISAFIKSLRSGQTDAVVYYLARLIASGEDPKYIARRMIIFASEDIGLAQPTALVVANAVFEAVEKVGLPEARINLAHGALYLAQCKKDRSVYDSIESALRDVAEYGSLPVPMNLRNAVTELMKEIGYGKGYKYYDEKSYLPEKIKNKKYFRKNQ